MILSPASSSSTTCVQHTSSRVHDYELPSKSSSIDKCNLIYRVLFKYRFSVFSQATRSVEREVFSFTRDVFSFFRPPFSEFPRPIALKLCHLIGIWLNFIMQVQKLGGALPPKNSGAKNMQNFGRFWTTSDFDREYLRKGPTYPKSESVTNYGNSSCV